MKYPEARFVVEVTADDEIVCRGPEQAEQRMRWRTLARFTLRQMTAGLGERTFGGC
jgi:hypothetical protein